MNVVLQIIQMGYATLAIGADNLGHLQSIRQGRRAIARAKSLTSRLARFGRPGSEKFQELYFDEILSEMHEVIRSVLPPSVYCEISCAESMQLVKGDRLEFEGVLLNLVINARDATPKGGRLAIYARNASSSEVAKVGLSAGEYVVIGVLDTGEGMSPEVLARATEAFFTTKQPECGAGLVLTIARDFAARSGGKLRIESSVGQGTLVEIYLRCTGGAPPKPA
jgi:signal transduction histidine kinase